MRLSLSTATQFYVNGDAKNKVDSKLDVRVHRDVLTDAALNWPPSLQRNLGLSVEPPKLPECPINIPATHKTWDRCAQDIMGIYKNDRVARRLVKSSTPVSALPSSQATSMTDRQSYRRQMHRCRSPSKILL